MIKFELIRRKPEYLRAPAHSLLNPSQSDQVAVRRFFRNLADQLNPYGFDLDDLYDPYQAERFSGAVVHMEDGSIHDFTGSDVGGGSYPHEAAAAPAPAGLGRGAASEPIVGNSPRPTRSKPEPVSLFAEEEAENYPYECLHRFFQMRHEGKVRRFMEEGLLFWNRHAAKYGDSFDWAKRHRYKFPDKHAFRLAWLRVNHKAAAELHELGGLLAEW